MEPGGPNVLPFRQKTRPQAEKFIENAILDTLHLHGVFCWKVKSMGTYDQKIGRFRIPGKRYMKGCADIIGVYGGKLLAIEVKSAKGRPTEAQKIFLDRVNKEGGIAFVARSVDDVLERLKLPKPISRPTEIKP